jgi:hypothetical protein
MAWRHVTASGWAVAGAAALAVGTTGVWPVAAAEARTPDAAPSAPAEGDSLKQVQVVFRHGARTPLGKRYWPQLVDAWDVCGTLYEPVAVDITTDEGEPRPINAHDAEQVATVFKGGCARGELTREGQQQARSYGRWLRRRYVGELGLLPERQEEGVLVGRTTNYSRTVATLRGVLTGLYPDADRPFPVTTTEELDEILFGNAESCQRLKRLVAETASATRVESAAPPPDVRALQKRVRGALGLPPTEVVHFLDLHDAVTTMRAHGKPIPEGLQDYELLRAVEFQATKHFLSFVAPSAEPDVLRLGMGRLLALLVARMDAAAAAPEGSAQPRLYMYSGHDSTIMVRFFFLAVCSCAAAIDD